MGYAARGDFGVMFGHKRRRSKRDSTALLISGDPRRSEHVLNERPLRFRQGFEIKVRRPPSEGRIALSPQAYKLQAFRQHCPIAGLHFVGKEEKEPRLSAFICLVHEDRALT